MLNPNMAQYVKRKIGFALSVANIVMIPPIVSATLFIKMTSVPGMELTTPHPTRPIVLATPIAEINQMAVGVGKPFNFAISGKIEFSS